METHFLIFNQKSYKLIFFGYSDKERDLFVYKYTTHLIELTRELKLQSPKTLYSYLFKYTENSAK